MCFMLRLVGRFFYQLLWACAVAALWQGDAWRGAVAAASERTLSASVQRQAAGFSERSLGSFLDQSFGQALGVLLGVGNGARAREFIASWRQGVLFLVDPYIHLRRGYERPENVDDNEQQRRFEDLRNALYDDQSVQGRYSFVREFSFAVPPIWREKKWGPDPMMVFLDANPSYGAVRTDLLAWWPLLAEGGIMAGSNYTTDGDGSVVGVQSAVDEFAASAGLPVFVTDDEMEPAWLIQKPGR
eukprot:TRINITY_DN96554_c0_g1_i1.p1 TRINITY_DN96554_c0_g1~~TRINITY_DN96554_c0_g1_i1.p1  ORF type:complete len:243 (-),score=42.99 TRINITY_DN96554_c0_g1_i1:41-769(-)